MIDAVREPEPKNIGELLWSRDAVIDLEKNGYTLMGRYSGSALKDGVQLSIVQPDGSWAQIVHSVEEIAAGYANDTDVKIITQERDGENLWKEIWAQSKPDQTS